MLKKIITLYILGAICFLGLSLTYAIGHQASANNYQDENCLDDMVLPEAFCPNCGDFSTSFEAKYNCVPDFVDLSLYDKYGNIVFVSKDPAFKWRGIDNKGNRLEAGPYFYTIQCMKGPLGITRQGYTQMMEEDCLNEVPVAEKFSPNGDGLSDHFQILFRCPPDDFLIRIMDGLGKLVYQSDQSNFKWNGEDLQGNSLSQGSYMYIIQYTFAGKNFEVNGKLELER